MRDRCVTDMMNMLLLLLTAKRNLPSQSMFLPETWTNTALTSRLSSSFLWTQKASKRGRIVALLFSTCNFGVNANVDPRQSGICTPPCPRSFTYIIN